MHCVFFEFMISPSDTQPKIKISLTKSFGFGARWNLIYPSRWTQSQWMCWRCSASGDCKWPGGVTRTGRGQPIQADQYHYDLFTNWKPIILNHSALFQTWNCRQSTTSLPDFGLAVPLLYIYIIYVYESSARILDARLRLRPLQWLPRLNRSRHRPAPAKLSLDLHLKLILTFKTHIRNKTHEKT